MLWVNSASVVGKHLEGKGQGRVRCSAWRSKSKRSTAGKVSEMPPNGLFVEGSRLDKYNQAKQNSNNANKK